MSTIAIIGTVVSIAGAAYGAYQQNAAIEAANSAHPRPFVPIDIANTAKMAFIADKAGYDISDADWKKRFPLLSAGRDYNVKDMAGNLSGVVSPTVTNTLDKAGLSANLGNDQFKQARNLGQPVLSMEQRNRNYFQKLLGDNPQRTAGLSGQDVTRIAVANTGSQQNFNQGIFQSNIGKYNSQIGQNIQNTNAAIGGLGSLAGLLTQNQNYNSPYLSGPSYYGSMTGGANPNVGDYGVGGPHG